MGKVITFESGPFEGRTKILGTLGEKIAPTTGSESFIEWLEANAEKHAERSYNYKSNNSIYQIYVRDHSNEYGTPNKHIKLGIVSITSPRRGIPKILREELEKRGYEQVRNYSIFKQR